MELMKKPIRTAYMSVFIGLLLVIFANYVQGQEAYTTTDNIGYFRDSYLEMTVKPYTSVAGNWVTGQSYRHEFTVKNIRDVSGNLCLAYRFNEPLNYGKIYQSVTSGENILKSYTCLPPNTYNASNGVFYCWNTAVNGSLTLVNTHSFTGYSGNTAYWNETVFSENKIDRTGFINSRQINGRYYYYATIPLAYDPYETKRWEIEYIPTDNTRKWDLVLWGTAGDCTCIQIGTCNFVSVYDPAWYNQTWNQCTNLTITENTGVKRVNYPVEINVSGLTFAATTEIRVTDAPCNMNGTEISRDILDAGTGWAKILFLANISKSNNTVYGIYHDAPGVPAPVYQTDLSMTNGTYLFLNNSIFSIRIDDTYALIKDLYYAGSDWVGQGAARGLFTVVNFTAPYVVFGQTTSWNPNDCELGFSGNVKKVITCRNLQNGSFRMNYTFYAFSPYFSVYVDTPGLNYSGYINSLKPENNIGSSVTYDTGTQDIPYSWTLVTPIYEKWTTVWKTSTPSRYFMFFWNGTNSRFNNGTSGININASYYIDSSGEDSIYIYPSAYCGAGFATECTRPFFKPSNFILGFTNGTNASESYLGWYNPLNISFGAAGFSPSYITPNITTPNITTNISYSWDIGADLPIILIYCAADGVSLVTSRGRNAYTATGEPFSINQTDVQTCQYGCADSILTNLGYPGCKESNLMYALIFIVVTIGVVILVRFVSGRGG